MLTGRGAEQHTDGTDTVTAAINLALALGLPGGASSGYGCLTGQGNGQGGREHGQKSDQLPGYRTIDDPAARAHVAAVWGVEPDVAARQGGSRRRAARQARWRGASALRARCRTSLVSAPDALAVRRRLEALDLLVVCDFVPSETALLADVVLPVTQWAEEEGTMTNLEGRVLRRRKALDPPGEARSELGILADLRPAAGLRRPGSTPTRRRCSTSWPGRAPAVARTTPGSPTPCLDEHAEGLFWPCPEGSAGTPRMFVERFAHADGRARMVPTDPGGPADDLDADRPIYLVTGRVLAQYQSGAQTRRVAALNRAAGEPFVELHPRLARRLAVDDGDDVAVTSLRGTAVARARITTTIRPDTVFMPFHWPGEGMANAVTNDATDPISGMPEFKVCAVSVARADRVEALRSALPEQEVPA